MNKELSDWSEALKALDKIEFLEKENEALRKNELGALKEIEDLEYELETMKKIIKIYESELKKEREKRRQEK